MEKAVDRLNVYCYSLTAPVSSLDCSFGNTVCDYVVSNTSTNFELSYVFTISSLGKRIKIDYYAAREFISSVNRNATVIISRPTYVEGLHKMLLSFYPPDLKTILEVVS